MSISIPPLSGSVEHDDAETLIGTLAPTGGTPPYELVAIWPAGPETAFDPDRVALGVWRDRVIRRAVAWRARGERPAAAWRGRETRPEATFS